MGHATRTWVLVVMGILLLGVRGVSAAPRIAVDLNVDQSGIQSTRTVSQGQEFRIQLVVTNTGGTTLTFDKTVLEVFMNDMGSGVLGFGSTLELPRAGDLAALAPSLDAITSTPVSVGDSLHLEFPPASNPPYTLSSGRAGLKTSSGTYSIAPGASYSVAAGKSAAGISAGSIGTSHILADNVVGPAFSLAGSPVAYTTQTGTVTVVPASSTPGIGLWGLGALASTLALIGAAALRRRA